MIEKITYPLTGKELSEKVNQIIDMLGVGDISNVKVEDGNIVMTKENGNKISVALPTITNATSKNDGLLKAEDYNFLQNLKSSNEDGVSGLPMVIPYATSPSTSEDTTKVATVINGGVLSLKQGAMVMVAFQFAPYRVDGKEITLNINNTGAKLVTYSGAKNGYYTPAHQSNRILFVYDGSNWVCVSQYSYAYSSGSSGDSGGGDA